MHSTRDLDEAGVRDVTVAPVRPTALRNAGLLRADGISKTYPSAAGPVHALAPISLEIADGESMAVVGPSGSGKTTLLAVCCGIEEPTSGEVYFGGKALSSLREAERSRLRLQHVGIVFQTFQLVNTLTAWENVMMPLTLRGKAGGEQARSALAEVGLSHRLEHYPKQLSGGEQQRVAIARAYVARPRLLICDEPTGNLDRTTALVIEELLFELNARHRTALLLVTHNLALAARCQRLLDLGQPRG